MDIPVQHRLVHRVEVEVLLVVQARQHLAVLNVQTQMELLQIHVLVGVVQDLARNQTVYFVIIMDIPVQRRLVHRVEVEVEALTAAKYSTVHNVQTEMEFLQIHVLVGVVRHLARHQLG